jgi:hypothetical protein
VWSRRAKKRPQSEAFDEVAAAETQDRDDMQGSEASSAQDHAKTCTQRSMSPPVQTLTRFGAWMGAWIDLICGRTLRFRHPWLLVPSLD